jgi:Spy/CpxP family protein refolding chaperone
MKRSFVALFVILSSGLALAQLPGGPGGPPPAPRKPPLGKEARARYIMRQLDLTPDQTRQAEGLLESFSKSDQPSQEEFLGKVNALSEEFKKAQAANDKKEMDRISEALRGLGTNSVEEPQFIDSLRGVLNDAQKAELDATLERLKSNTAGQLRPIDVYRAATKLGLSAEQNSKIEETLASYREQLVQSQQPRDPASIDALRSTQIDNLVERIRPILTADQGSKFDKRVAAMRPEAPKPVPTTGPAKP